MIQIVNVNPLVMKPCGWFCTRFICSSRERSSNPISPVGRTSWYW